VVDAGRKKSPPLPSVAGRESILGIIILLHFPSDAKPPATCFKKLGAVLPTRVARWFLFEPKIPLWVNFGGSCNGRCWYINGHLVNFMAIWHILWPFGIFSPVLVHFTHFGIL
jgi:hypothetical protein